MIHMRIALGDINVGENFSREELGDLESLKRSLEQHGLQQPIIVSEGMELVAGFRRYNAACQLGWEKIDCVVTDQDPKLVNFIENLERKALSFYEECLAVHDLYDGCTDQEVADAVGRTISWSRPRNKLFTLPQEIIDLAKAGEVTPSKVTMILNAKNRQEVIDKLLDRSTPDPKERFRPGKKHLQAMMTVALERGLHDVVQTFRYVIGDIDEESFWDEVDKS